MPTKNKPEKTSPQILTSLFGMDELPKMVSGSTYNTYRKMRRDPTIALARWLIAAPILASDWSFEEKNDAPEEARDFIDEQLSPLQMHLMKTGLYGCIDFGWQPYEKVWELNEEGRVVVRKVKPLLQDLTTIRVDVKTGAYAGLRQGKDNLDMRVEETLLYYFDVEGTDWYGQSLMENIREVPYDGWNTINKAADRYDRKIAGSHWVIYYPIGTSTIDGQKVDNFQVAKRLLNTLEASGAIAVPKQIDEIIDELNEKSPKAWEIELLSDSSSARSNFTDRMKYLDALKVRGLGLPERAVLEGEFGTKAEAEAHADFAITNMELRHKQLVQLTNWHLVNHLLILNFGPAAANTVYIEPAPITDLALTYLRDIYKQFITQPEGMLAELTHVDLESLRDRLGIPTLPESDQPGVTEDTEI